jgi:ubiquinone/menaquinone biosynthesis C-methylase UbiE
VRAAEFDDYAQDYQATHARNVRISGEAPDYFARYKIEEVRRVWSRSRLPEPQAVLDFGAGVGNSLPHLAALFPTAALTALDVSAESLAIARQRFTGAADFVCYQGGDLPAPAGDFDLVFSSCVFHHIDAAEHVAILARLKRLLTPDGRLVIFEHNPLNPVTRYIVATCEFDADAVLIPAGTLKARQKAAGFARVSASYTGFFPGPLKALRPLERFMTALPVGAQYYTMAHA